MSSQNHSFLKTAYHVACGLGVVLVVCGLFNLWSCLLVGVILAVIGTPALIGSALLYDGVVETYKRIANR